MNTGAKRLAPSNKAFYIDAIERRFGVRHDWRTFAVLPGAAMNFI